jgi:hypothetical protein
VVAVVLLLLELDTVVERLGGGSRVLVGGMEVVSAGRLGVVGVAGVDAATGRRLVTRAAATPTATPHSTAMTMIGSSDRPALHRGRPGLARRWRSECMSSPNEPTSQPIAMFAGFA